MRNLFAVAAASLALATPAFAQDNIEVVREVVHGGYFKTGVGGTIFLGKRRQVLNPGTTLMLSGGYDFYTNSLLTVSGDLMFNMSIHGGLPAGDQAAFLNGGALTADQLTQGDVLLMGGQAMFKVAFYPVRRVALGIRAGGGVGFAPKLIPGDEYDIEITQRYGVRPAVHENPLPVFGGGLNFEYFTKLSHLSLGIDIDFMYFLNLDFALVPSGFFKYTF